MNDAPDAQLLEQFARNQSEAAFAELVERHIGLVYSTALRKTNNPQQAEDITQAVFIILARKAGSLGSKTVLPGWLYHTARLTAANLQRAELRRVRREQEAFMQSTMNESALDTLWRELSPLLEDAMAGLGASDRDAIVLRFFQNRSMAEVGAALGASEDAAKMRVNRAVEKLRKFFNRRGVVSTTAIIAGVISSNSVQAAPAALAKTISAVALAKGAAASASTLTLVKGGLKVMAWTKTQTAVVIVAGILLATGTAAVAIREADTGSVSDQVFVIVKTHEDNSGGGAAMIAKIGPKALPGLDKLIRWRKPWWDFFDTTEEEKMRASAIKIVTDLGPAAVRPLTSALCDAINDPDLINKPEPDDLTALNATSPACQALYHWSVPESSRATAALTQWLSHPERSLLFAWGDDDFQRLPNSVELLIPWLKNHTEAYQVAHIFGLMGTNAAAAVPALIDVCRHGVVTNPPPFRVPSSNWYTPPGKKKPVWRTTMVTIFMNDEEKERNRSYALEALGQIGVASPEVVATLQQALYDTNDVVRFGALKAIYALHLQPDRPLADALNNFTPRRDISFDGIVGWTGHLGSEGQDALPWLQRLTTFDYVESLPEGVHANVGDFAVSTEDLQGAATLAILEIDPSQIKPKEINGAELLRQFYWDWEATKRVMSETNATAVVTILRPFLISSNITDASFAAYIILGLAPNDEQALQTLRRYAGEGSLSDRLSAAYFLWMRTGKSEELLHLAVEGLKSPDTIQGAPQFLAKLGEDARPAIPALKDALWGQDVFGRYFAGDALQKIAPEELPPIH